MFRFHINSDWGKYGIPDNWHIITSSLSVCDILAASCVCRTWRRLIRAQGSYLMQEHMPTLMKQLTTFDPWLLFCSAFTGRQYNGMKGSPIMFIEPVSGTILYVPEIYYDSYGILVKCLPQKETLHSFRTLGRPIRLFTYDSEKHLWSIDQKEDGFTLYHTVITLSPPVTLRDTQRALCIAISSESCYLKGTFVRIISASSRKNGENETRNLHDIAILTKSHILWLSIDEVNTDTVDSMLISSNMTVSGEFVTITNDEERIIRRIHPWGLDTIAHDNGDEELLDHVDMSETSLEDNKGTPSEDDLGTLALKMYRILEQYPIEESCDEGARGPNLSQRFDPISGRWLSVYPSHVQNPDTFTLVHQPRPDGYAQLRFPP